MTDLSEYIIDESYSWVYGYCYCFSDKITSEVTVYVHTQNSSKNPAGNGNTTLI